MRNEKKKKENFSYFFFIKHMSYCPDRRCVKSKKKHNRTDSDPTHIEIRCRCFLFFENGSYFSCFLFSYFLVPETPDRHHKSRFLYSPPPPLACRSTPFAALCVVEYPESNIR
jgi:hypothetical protein